jgi:hypothetical protein
MMSIETECDYCSRSPVCKWKSDHSKVSSLAWGWGKRFDICVYFKVREGEEEKHNQAKPKSRHYHPCNNGFTQCDVEEGGQE